MIQKLTKKMTEYFSGDPKRIQHFIKVHSFARYIGLTEELPEHEQLLLECAALVHDIGIKPAEERFGECGGKLQEQLGPAEAEKILCGLSFPPEDVERICFMVAHHHTYDNISDPLLQILVEADFIVNLYEDAASREAVVTAYRRIFRTGGGKELLRTIWALSEVEE